MNSESAIDKFFRHHPRLHVAVVLLLSAIAIIVLLGGYRSVGLVYKAF